MARTKTKPINRIADLSADNGKESTDKVTVRITPPKMEEITLTLRGIAPLCIHRFSEKAKEQMRASQAAGSVSQSRGKKREPKDFEALYEQAKYQDADGWDGINATAFRNAAIAACRTVGFKMTHAKLGIFVHADGFDHRDGTPLVRITSGKPEQWIAPARNDNGGMDLRVRPLWREWGCVLRIRYDAEMFTAQDVTNLMARVGMQVGICEGRPNSPKSAGLGYGLFAIEEG